MTDKEPDKNVDCPVCGNIDSNPGERWQCAECGKWYVTGPETVPGKNDVDWDKAGQMTIS